MGEEIAGLARAIFDRFAGPLLPFIIWIFFGVLWAVDSDPVNAKYWCAATVAAFVWWAWEVHKVRLAHLQREQEDRARELFLEEEQRRIREAAARMVEEKWIAMHPQVRDAFVRLYEAQGRPDILIANLRNDEKARLVIRHFDRDTQPPLGERLGMMDGDRAMRFQLSELAKAILDREIDGAES